MDRMRRRLAVTALLLALAVAFSAAAGPPEGAEWRWLGDLWGRVVGWFTGEGGPDIDPNGAAGAPATEGPDIDPNGAAAPPQSQAAPAGGQDGGPDIDPDG